MNEDVQVTKLSPKEEHLSRLAVELAEWRRQRQEMVSKAEGARGVVLEGGDLRELDISLERARWALDDAEKSPAKLWVQAKARVDAAFQSLREAEHKVRSPC